MSRTLLVVGTRKGCFLLESDEARRDWEVRGPFCEGWPIYHAVIDPTSGTIYAAAASEWHGSAVWRSTDLGETWTHSSEGLAYDEDGERKVSKVSTPRRSHTGRLLVGVEAPGIFESRDDGDDLVAPLARSPASPGSEDWDDPANQPPGHLGLSALLPDPAEPDALLGDRAGNRALRDDRRRRDLDAAQHAACAPTGRAPHEDVGFCVHKVVRSPVDGDRMYQQNHVGMHRSDDCGQTWTEITEGLPTEFGFAAAAHPHDRDTLLRRSRSTRATAARCPTARLSVWRTRDAWLELAASSTSGLPQRDAYLGVLREGMANDTYDVPGLLLRHEHRPALRERRRRRDLGRDRELPARRSRPSRSRSSTDAMAELHLPMTLTPLFPEPPSTDRAARRRRSTPRSSSSTSAGRACATGSASRARCIRPHIHVYVDRERAALDNAARAELARRRDRRDQRRLDRSVTPGRAASRARSAAADRTACRRNRARRAGLRRRRRARSTWPLNMITGIEPWRSCICCSICQPSTPGMTTSSRTRSGAWSSIAASASSALAASRTGSPRARG